MFKRRFLRHLKKRLFDKGGKYYFIKDVMVAGVEYSVGDLVPSDLNYKQMRRLVKFGHIVSENSDLREFSRNRIKPIAHLLQGKVKAVKDEYKDVLKEAAEAMVEEKVAEVIEDNADVIEKALDIKDTVDTVKDVVKSVKKTTRRKKKS